MGFKSMEAYNDEKYGNFFRLQNDGDYADVVFLYRGTHDVMMADTHYIKSDDYSGYVTCCGKGCPACSSTIRVQPKIFIPLFVLNTTDASGISNRIQFWDRTARFQPQLLNDVFRAYPNPSEFIFRITRHGIARSIDTTYDIRAIQPNTPDYSYDAICSKFGAVFPAYYNLVCKEVDLFELNNMVSSGNQSQNQNSYGGNNSYNGGNNYGATPRGTSSYVGSASNMGTIPGTEIPYTSNIDAPNLSMPNVPLNTAIPDEAPDPNNLPFGAMNPPSGAENEVASTILTNEPADPNQVDGSIDPNQTDEDIDTTNLKF